MKPRLAASYGETQTGYCEMALVTLMDALRPQASRVYLIGGMVPRYLIRPHPADDACPVHVGTMDVDPILDMALVVDRDAFEQVRQRLVALRFVPARDDNSRELQYRWLRRLDTGHHLVVDLLREDQPPGTGSAPPSRVHRSLPLPLRGAHLAVRDYVEVALQAEHLDQGAQIAAVVRVAGIVPFIVLKALAYEDREEPKDAYDLVYCLMYYADGRERRGPEAVAAAFARRMAEWPDEPLFSHCLRILHRHFASDEAREGYRKPGPRRYADFLTPADDPGRHAMHCRDAAAVVEEFLEHLAARRPGQDGS